MSPIRKKQTSQNLTSPDWKKTEMSCYGKLKDSATFSLEEENERIIVDCAVPRQLIGNLIMYAAFSIIVMSGSDRVNDEVVAEIA